MDVLGCLGCFSRAWIIIEDEAAHVITRDAHAHGSMTSTVILARICIVDLGFSQRRAVREAFSETWGGGCLAQSVGQEIQEVALAAPLGKLLPSTLRTWDEMGI